MKRQAAEQVVPAPPSRARSPGGWLQDRTRAARRAVALPWVQDVLALFVASRVAFVLVTYVGYVLIQAPKYSDPSVGVAQLLTSWDQWDAQRYLTIATSGYTNATDTAFFPLYPLIVRVLSAPFGPQAAYTVGLIVSNLAMLGALLALHALVRQRWGEQVAWRAVLYLTVFPTALFTFAPYNESLFLLLSVGCFLALGRQRWALAGTLGGLASLTRAAGILLLIPFAVEWWRQHQAGVWRAAATGADDGRAKGVPPYRLKASGGLLAGLSATGLWRTVRVLLPGTAAPSTRASVAGADAPSPGRAGAAWGAVGWALLVPAGLGLYAAYCAVRFGDALAFSHAQASWNRVLTWPWVSVWWQLQGLSRAAPASFFQVHDLLDLVATAGFAALLVVGWRRLPAEQSLYAAALLLLMLVEPGGVNLHTLDPMMSNSRFVLEMFPGFIVLALLTARSPRWHQAVVVVFSALLATLTLVFILGRWLV